MYFSNNLKSEEQYLPPLQYDVPDISLKRVLNDGKGIITELVSKWIASTGIHPKKLIEIFDPPTAENEKSFSKNSIFTNRKLTPSDLKLEDDAERIKLVDKRTNLEPVLYCLDILRDHFPFSLQSKSLLCSLTWDYFSFWSRNLTEFYFMRAGLDCLKAFHEKDWKIKHGLCIMIWNAHLKIILKAVKTLIDKTGRLPKEKFCIQDIGISDVLVPKFLEYCIEFMQEFVTSNHYEHLHIKFEELLIHNPDKVPLIQLAAEQGTANLELLNLHSQLLKVLFIISYFNLKYQKPVQNLFNGMANMSFFADIKKQLPYIIPEADLILKKNRLEFLLKIVTATMDLIREDQQEIYLLDHNKWMDEILKMGDIWELNRIDIRQHQVTKAKFSEAINVFDLNLTKQIVELYYYGWDPYAETLLEQDLDIKNIGSLLLSIAGVRLNLFIKDDPKALQLIAGAGPLLFDYLDTLVSVL